MGVVGRNAMFVLVAAMFLGACGGGSHEWRAQSISGSGLEISPIRVWTASGKLWFRTDFRNSGSVPVMVQRDAITVSLPNGQVLQRAQSGFGAIHTPYIIPPGGSHLVYVEYTGAEWRDVPNAQLNFTGAISVGGQMIQIPPMAIAP